MRKTINALALLVISILAFSWAIKEKDFHVTIEQRGQIIRPINGEVSLDKSEFTIVCEFTQPMGLLINASFNKKTYELANKGKSKSELPGFENTGMAAELLNPNKEICLSEDAPNYWYYENNEENRFDTIDKVQGKIICKRIIQNLHDVENNRNIKVENVTAPLYLVFISKKPGKDVMNDIEIKRESVEIRWRE
jgi:hypothetical protein